MSWVARLLYACAALVLIGSAGAAGEIAVFGPISDIKPDDSGTGSELRALLTARGYTGLPLNRINGRTELLLDVSRDGVNLRLLVDTGAAWSVVDSAAAKRLNLTVTDTTKQIGGLSFDGGIRSTKAAFVAGVQTGGVHVPSHQWNVLDMSGFIDPLVKSGGPRYDGILGADLLTYYAAVIDVAGGRLYLLDPIRQAPGLQGEWASAWLEFGGRRYDGTEFPLAVRLRITGGRVRFEQGGRTTEYFMVMDRRVETKSFDLYTAGGDLKMLTYDLCGDRLTVALPLVEGDDRTKRPMELTAPADSKHTVIRFTRVKPANKK